MKEQFEDRSARARRHELSPVDARKLDEELAGSAEARLWHRAGLEFDAEGAVLPGDHGSSERVIQRLLRDLPRAPARSRVRWVALLAAAAVLVASVAGAAVVGVRMLRQEAVLPSASANTAPSPSPATPSAIGARSLPAPDPAPSDEPAMPPSPAVIATAAASSSAAPSALPGTPAELFSAAGQARRRGDPSQARVLLQALQQRFPNSAEARSSDITLGMLQLKSGVPALALRHFDRYLARSPGGELAAEALWGRAQAQFAQGNPTEGRRALSTLLERFPGSAHASAARAKLAQP